MKLLFVIDNLCFGGAQKIFSFVANELVKKEYKVAVVSYASDEIPHFGLDDRIQFFSGGAYKHNGIVKHFEKLPCIREVIKMTMPEVIIAFSAIPTLLGILASHNKIPVIYCERGDPNQYNSLKDKVMFLGLRLAKWSVFQTEQAQKCFGKKIVQRSTVIPNPAFDVSVKRVCDYSTIAFVGRFEIRQKRQDLMVEAFEKILKKYPNAKLAFYGAGEDLEYIEQMCCEKKIIDSVCFKGKVENVCEEIAKAFCFVLTSDYEGIPNALIEAMSIGRPCVSTDCSPGGAKMLIDNYENGILVPCGDVDAVADAVTYLYDNPKEADRMGETAKMIIEKYHPDVIVEKWIEAIENAFYR